MKAQHIGFEESLRQLKLHQTTVPAENSFSLIPCYGQLIPNAVILHYAIIPGNSENPELKYGTLQFI